jgi:hypothetical protein
MKLHVLPWSKKADLEDQKRKRTREYLDLRGREREEAVGGRKTLHSEERRHIYSSPNNWVN